MTEQLDQYLESRFGIETLASFRKAGGIVRFPLDVEPRADEETRLRGAVTTASALFEQLFQPGEKGYMACFCWTEKRSDEDPVPRVLEAVNADVEYSTGQNFYGTESSDEAIMFTRLVAAVVPRALDYPSVFAATANADLGRLPTTSWRTFFVNESEPLLFHMYDDRGVDVLSGSPSAAARVDTAASAIARPGESED